ncbi:aspartic peptidase domain-containing protein [Xylogone sp. PMI_703]|nr:aspartic peptidase domain-containing protein [Xylogone sp. PMI_703]
MKVTKTTPVLASMLGAASIAKAAPFLSSRQSSSIRAIPLINHNNGQFWSTGVQVEGIPSGFVDTALDTGGGQFIVPSSTAPPCEQGNCQRGTLDVSQLQHLEDLNIPFSESFGSGTITGGTFRDDVSMGGVDLGTMQFEIATDGTGTALSAGTVGLGHTNNFTPELVNIGTIETQTFSLLLSASGGEMMLGGINPGLFTGTLLYVPGASAGDGFFRVDITNFGFSGPTNPGVQNTQFILDTGTPTTALPNSAIQDIATDFGGSVQNNEAVVPCGNIAGQTFAISWSSTVGFIFPMESISTTLDNDQCRINLGGTDGTPVIGVDLLSRFYTFWQVESNTLGFAFPSSNPDQNATPVVISDPNNLPTVVGQST